LKQVCNEALRLNNLAQYCVDEFTILGTLKHINTKTMILEMCQKKVSDQLRRSNAPLHSAIHTTVTTLTSCYHKWFQTESQTRCFRAVLVFREKKLQISVLACWQSNTLAFNKTPQYSSTKRHRDQI